jgi:uncharacterized protein YqjF (DUF2071 family)
MNMIPSFTVEMDIENVLYLSYLVPVERIRPYVPAPIPFAFTDGGKTVFSVVMFRSTDVGASFLPFLRFTYDQANVRTYVIDPLTGEPAVFFLKSGITSRLVSVATAALGIPWHFVPLKVSAEYEEGTLRRYGAEGKWEGNFHVNLAGTKEPAGDALLGSPREAARFITGPRKGFYGLKNGLVRFEVRHSIVEPIGAQQVTGIDFPLVTRLGLLLPEESGSPLNIIVARKAHFTVSMPPRIITLPGRKEDSCVP